MAALLQKQKNGLMLQMPKLKQTKFLSNCMEQKQLFLFHVRLFDNKENRLIRFWGNFYEHATNCRAYTAKTIRF